MRLKLKGIRKRFSHQPDDYQINERLFDPTFGLTGEARDDDTSSVGSFSTNATFDDNIGPGRVLDKYLYQPAGRKVEQFASWIRLVNTGMPKLNAAPIEADNDASSMSSSSTNATADDIPGTGRVMDKYMYQKGGRKVERLIFWVRIRMPNLDPAQISKYFESLHEKSMPTGSMEALQECVRRIAPLRDGSTIISGLKNLVKQTQSVSLSRSAAALSSLIHVSLLENRDRSYDFAGIYLAISCEEPILHVGSLATSLDDSSVEKMFIRLLVNIAKANVILLQRDGSPSSEFSLHLRQQLMELLEARRLFRNKLVEYVADACLIHAYAIASLPISHEPLVSVHITETVYFLVIFFLQSIPELYSQSRSVTHESQLFIHMVLSTLVDWIGGSIRRYGNPFDGRPAPGLWESRIDFLSLLHTYPMSRLIPLHWMSSENDPLILRLYLPRRLRATIVDRLGDSQMIEESKRRSTQRSVRLLSSFSELEWEVWDSYRRRGHTAYQMEDVEAISDNLIEQLECVARVSIYGAQNVHVQEDDITAEFLAARESELVDDECDPEEGDFGLSQWCFYSENCYLRHEFAPYLSSNLDWDWDLAGSLELLYRLDSPAFPIRSQHPAADNATEESVGVQGQTWNVKSGAAQTELPNEVRIEYRTEAGGIQYTTFVPKSSEPSTGGKDLSDGPVAVLTEPSSQDFVAQPEYSQQSLKSPADLSENGSSVPEDGNKEFSDSLWPDQKTIASTSAQVPAERADTISICSIDKPEHNHPIHA